MTSTGADVKGEGGRILELTRQPRVSLSAIAREAGCSVAFVSMCAHGRRRPTARVLAATERLLGQSADGLYPCSPASRPTGESA